VPTELEKDPFLVLLTDALRAGPGSPEWRDAVAKLKTSDQNVDEYRLLIEAREALESGKDYRSVQAGPGFTRKLMTNLEQEPEGAASRRPFPLAGFIAALAGLVILGLIALVVYKAVSRNPVNPGTRSSIDDLQATYFPNPVLATNFDSGIPAGWRTIGSLPVTADKGLRPGDAAVPEGGYIGGGIVMTAPLAADQSFSAQITLEIKGAGDALIPQVFVSNSPDFSPDRATGPQELVWQLQGNEEKVVVSGRVERQSPLPSHTQSLTIRFVLNKDLAIVESDGKRLWAGPNALGDQPRYLGVRFVRTNGKSTGDVSFQKIQVQKS
jgi:hypothetical protein